MDSASSEMTTKTFRLQRQPADLPRAAECAWLGIISLCSAFTNIIYRHYLSLFWRAWTRHKDMAFTDSEGERISDHCSVWCIRIVHLTNIGKHNNTCNSMSSENIWNSSFFTQCADTYTTQEVKKNTIFQTLQKHLQPSSANTFYNLQTDTH